MAVSMGYDQSVRQLLNSKNVDNSRIGYNPLNKSVTVDGTDFMKPNKVYGGTSYTNQQGFNSAWDTYSKPKANPTVYGTTTGSTAGGAAPAAGSTTGYTSPTQPAPVKPTADDQYSQILNTLMQQIQNPTPVDVNAVYASPQYAAFQAQAQRGANEGIRAAQESLGSSGFGRSTMLGERAQGIQNDANTYLQSQVLPQLIAQQQAAQQQQNQNQFGLLDSLYGQQQLGDSRAQNQEVNAINRAGVTGTYLSPEMQSLYNAVLQDKQAYGAATTPEARAQAAADANALRQQIAGLGGNPDLVGANVTYDQAAGNAPRFGTQTIQSQGQEFDQNLATDQQNLNETQVMAALTGFMPDGTPTTAQQQQNLANLWAVADSTGTIPEQLATLYNLPKGTQTQAAKQFAMNYNRGVLESDRNYNRGITESDRNYNRGVTESDRNYDRGVVESDRNYNQDQAKQDQPLTASPNEVGTLLQNLQLQGQDSGGKTYYYIPGKGKDSRNEWVAQTVQTLVDANYDNATIEQVLRKAGISQDEENTIFSSGK